LNETFDDVVDVKVLDSEDAENLELLERPGMTVWNSHNCSLTEGVHRNYHRVSKNCISGLH
jgi:hypothetical protein